MYLQACESFKSAKSQKVLDRKSQIRKVSNMRKVSRSNKLFKSANLRIRDLQNLFVDRPPLLSGIKNHPHSLTCYFNKYFRSLAIFQKIFVDFTELSIRITTYTCIF